MWIKEEDITLPCGHSVLERTEEHHGGSEGYYLVWPGGTCPECGREYPTDYWGAYEQTNMNRKYFLIDNIMYTREGYFGCQLCSEELRTPAAGTSRFILGRRFTIFRTKRKGLKVLCYWGMNLSKNLDTAHFEIKELEDDLCKLF